MVQEYTARFTEVHELGDGIAPDTYAPGQWNGGWNNMGNHQRAIYILRVGAMAQGSLIQMSVYEAQDATGTGAQLIDDKYITALTHAGGDDDSTCAIEVRTEEMTPGYGFTEARVLVNGGNVQFCVLALLGTSNQTPVSTARWTEIVD